MVQELNTYIGFKKQRQDDLAAKAELIGTSGRKGAAPEKTREGESSAWCCIKIKSLCSGLQKLRLTATAMRSCHILQQ